MLTPAGIGTLITSAALLGIGAAANYPELVQLGAVGALAVGVSAVLSWRRPSVDVQIHLPRDRIVAGETPRLLVTMVNRKPWRCFVTLLRVQIGEVPINIELGSVKAGAEATFAPRLPPFRRGVYTLSNAQLGYRDPFGFARSTHSIPTATTLYVYPRTVVVPPLPTGGPQDLDGRPLLKPVAGGDTFYSLREYGPGDSWRKIHWPTTARRATLMVRHTTVPEETAHTVVLDTERQAYANEGCFEQAVGIAASMCQAAMRAGHALTLLTGTQSVVSEPTNRYDQTGTSGPALDLLARARWTEAGTDRRMLEWVPAGASLMVVTGHPVAALTVWLSDIGRHVSTSHLVQVLAPAQRPVDSPAGVLALSVAGLDEFRATWSRWNPP